MNIVSKKPDPDRFFGRSCLLFVVLLLPISVFAQLICECPVPASCSPCLGGITKLTLRYNVSGNGSDQITAADGGGTVFSGTVRRGDTFSFSSKKANEKFEGANIVLSINGKAEASIGTGCGGLEIGKDYSEFFLLAAESKNGGPLCCPPDHADGIRPIISNCPPTIDISATGGCQAIATWTPPTATDNCSIVALTSTHNPGTSFPVGTTKITYTAKDIRGNTNTCTFDIHVRDDVGPTFIGCPEDITVAGNAKCEATVDWKAPSVKDNCTPSVVSSTHKPGARFKQGKTTVTYTAIDMRGNRSTCSFNVNVIKTETPTITECPEQITLPSDELGEAVVRWREPEAIVGCGDVTVKRTHAPGTLFKTGTTKVTYTFTSDAGNTATCSFDVTVLKPEIRVDISKAVTPDGDGIHDRWELKHIEKYANNDVLIMDRWGNKVFEASGYDNERVYWDGRSQQGAKVPTGTYFYIVKVRVQDVMWQQKGSLEVIQ